MSLKTTAMSVVKTKQNSRRLKEEGRKGLNRAGRSVLWCGWMRCSQHTHTRIHCFPFTGATIAPSATRAGNKKRRQARKERKISNTQSVLPVPPPCFLYHPLPPPPTPFSHFSSLSQGAGRRGKSIGNDATRDGSARTVAAVESECCSLYRKRKLKHKIAKLQQQHQATTTTTTTSATTTKSDINAKEIAEGNGNKFV